VSFRFGHSAAVAKGHPGAWPGGPWDKLPETLRFCSSLEELTNEQGLCFAVAECFLHGATAFFVSLQRNGILTDRRDGDPRIFSSD
jgi:hypothetical protein